MTVKALILLSGGIDSTVVLAMATQNNRQCFALTFDYGQRHRIELEHAKIIAASYQAFHKIITIDPDCFKGSALLDSIKAPLITKNRSRDTIEKGGVPNTYVPARNTLFLAFAMGQAEILEADEIYAGPNLLDRNPYPDCRPEFYQAFQEVINTGTKQSLVSTPPKLLTPLIDWDKKRIVQEGIRLKAPLHLTFSCYDPQEQVAEEMVERMGKIKEKTEPCGACDACVLRKEALEPFA